MNCVEITEKNKSCFKCGMCYSVCNSNAISVNYRNTTGFYNFVLDTEKCVDCGMCMKSCPSLDNDFENNDIDVGKFEKLLLVHSTQYTVRHECTSGGVINTLVKFLIDKNIVECVLLVQQNDRSSVGAWMKVINADNVNELSDSPRKFASRYVSIPVLSGIKELINIKRIAVVGTPCQIKALCKYNELYKGKSILKIGIACSAGISYKATEQLKKLILNKGMRNSHLTIYYRGDGWPGKNTIITERGKKEKAHNQSLFERMFTSQVFKNEACNLCKDQLAMYSDISAFDFWNPDEIKNEHEGNTGIIIRNKKMESIIRDMIDEGYIKIKSELTEKDIVNSQSRVLYQKKWQMWDKGLLKYYSKLTHLIFYSGFYKLLGRNSYKLLCMIYHRCYIYTLKRMKS